jgi:hypothetical protein
MMKVKGKDDFGFSMPQSRSLWTWRLLETELLESRKFGLRKTRKFSSIFREAVQNFC